MDSIFLGAVGAGIGSVFFDKLSQIGVWGRLVGFCVALVYFSFFDSGIGHGQTFGKRWMKIRAIDAQGNTISLAKSFLRSVIFLVPSFLYEMRLPETRTPWIVSALIFVVVLWVGGSTFYLIAFNRDSRQGLHDLSVGSYVADVGCTGSVASKPIAKVLWAILGVLLVTISATTRIATTMLEQRPPLPQMRRDADLVEQLEGVQRAQVSDMLLHSPSGGGTNKDLVARIILRSDSLSHEAFAGEVAKVILRNDQSAQNYDQLRILLFRGYDIGIFQRWNHDEYTHSPTEWQRLLSGSPSPASAQQ
jgi:uncharacterized RDD family membrane protein YckC